MGIIPPLDRMERDPIAIARLLVIHFEGWRPKPYLCPAGLPTIGFGFTHYANGRRVKLIDEPMSHIEADHLLTIQLIKIKREIEGLAPIFSTRPEALGASIDFCFNLGVARFKASTLLRRLMAEDWDEVEVEIHRWTKAKGQVMPGLVKRREAEANLYRLCNTKPLTASASIGLLPVPKKTVTVN